jgi:DNA-binding NarL/FixJ family response regulator
MVDKFNNKIIRILVAESQELVLLGLCKVIEDHPSLNVTAVTDKPDVALDLVLVNKPDVILFDLSMNNGESIQYITHLLNACPQSRILALSNNNNDQAHLDALRSGVAGIFYKQQSAALLLKAIHIIASGEVWFDSQITKLICQAQASPSLSSVNSNDAKTQKQRLTERECNVACLASKGLSAKKIGEQLFISEKTVRNNLTLVYDKLAIGNQVELCIKIEQLNFCQLPDQSRNRDKCPYKKG